MHYQGLFPAIIILFKTLKFTWIWCFAWYKENFQNLAQILQYWKTENVDNFDITNHVYWFWIVCINYWNWGPVYKIIITKQREKREKVCIFNTIFYQSKKMREKSNLKTIEPLATWKALQVFIKIFVMHFLST